ncbi:MAG: DUF362 domain-containing protein [Candidatus Thorarchaeota archaeon]
MTRDDPPFNKKLFKTISMVGEIVALGQVMFSREGTRETFMEIVSKLDLNEPVLIKPNWSTSTIFTEATILDWTLTALKCEKIVVESYAHYRSPIFRDHYGPFDADFDKMLAGQKKRDLQENDRWFLDFTGIGDVLREHDVEYLNLSEELWSKQICEPDRIRTLVESRFEPLVNDIMYSMVPTRLYDMRGGTLLSLAKPKLATETIGITLSIKNLFGLISTPYRGKFHGTHDTNLNDSIMDINKIYHSLFDVRGIVEAVFTTSGSEDFLGRSTILHDLGLIWGSNNVFELDATVTTQLGLDTQQVGHLALAAQTFGQLSLEAKEIAKKEPVKLL